MPLFYAHIALSENEPLPPKAELAPIEAADLAEAGAKLARMKIVGEPKQDYAWVRIVTAFGPNDEVVACKVRRAQLRPLSMDN